MHRYLGPLTALPVPSRRDNLRSETFRLKRMVSKCFSCSTSEILRATQRHLAAHRRPAPVGLIALLKGALVSKNQGISEVEQEKHFETIRFNETFRYEDYPGGWEPAARLKDQDTDGIDAEVLFSSAVRQLYSITDEPFQCAIFHSYNAWLHEFCSLNPKRLIGLATLSILDIEHTVSDIRHYAKLGFRGVQIPTRIRDSGYYELKYEPMWAALEECNMIVNVHTSATQGVARTHYEGPRDVDPQKQPLGLATNRLRRSSSLAT